MPGLSTNQKPKDDHMSVTVSGVKLTDEQIEWLADYVPRWAAHGHETYGLSAQIMQAVWDALPVDVKP